MGILTELQRQPLGLANSTCLTFGGIRKTRHGRKPQVLEIGYSSVLVSQAISCLVELVAILKSWHR